MSQLIQVADFKFIALKDGVDITDQDRKKFTTMSLSDEYFTPQMVDIATSLALIDEFDKCPFTDDVFINDIAAQVPQITKTNDLIYIRPSYSVKNTKIPLLLQKAGLKMKRRQFVAYLARGTNPEEPYILVDKGGAPFETQEKASNGCANKLNIDIYDDILALRPDEYEKYLYVKKQIDAGKFAEVNKQDLYLWALTESFITRREKLDVVFHEMKHAQNSLIVFDYLFNNPNCKLSGVDIFKNCRDDELSAKLAEAIEAINTYNQSKDKNDLSVFESSYILQQLLQGKDISERKKLLSNIPYIVREVCMYWYKNYATGYMPQFVQNTLVGLSQISLKHLVRESDGASYNDIRKLMFTYNVYDINTGRYINMDLSEYIIDIGIAESDLKMTQQMYQDNVIKRQEFLSIRADAIQSDLITDAQEKYKKLVVETEYRKVLTDLQSKGMDYMSALNFIPGVTDVNEKQAAKPVATCEISKKQIAEHKPEQEPKRIIDIFKNAIHKITSKHMSRAFKAKCDDGPDYL